MADSVPDHLRSLNNDIQSYVRFVNCTERKVHLFWLDYKGSLVRYGNIPSHRTVSMYTYVTHPWVARDASNNYPLMFNGKQIFYPVTERNGHIFNPENMERVNIHIPVFPLFRRCLETVYQHLKREAIATADIPMNIKDILLKMTPCIEFRDYKHFSTTIYENIDDDENYDYDKADNDSDNDDEDDEQ